MAATTPGKIDPTAWASPVRKKTRKPRAPAASERRRLITNAAPEMAVPGIEPGRVLPRWILSPLRLPVPPDGLERGLLSTPARRGKIRASAGEDLRGKPDALAERRVRVDGAADVLGVGAHLDGEADLRDQVARVQPDDPPSDHAPVRLVVEQLDESLVAAVRDRPSARRPGEDRLSVFLSARL